MALKGASMTDLKQRSLAVDVMRGLTLMLMIIVNMALDEQRSYGQLLHSIWHGFTLTDAVFPAFLFSVGVSLALSMDRQRLAGETAFRARVLRRTALLFAIGFVLSWLPFFAYDPTLGVLQFIDLGHTRILGVLQRIALTYGLAAVLTQRFGTRGAWVALCGSLLIYPFILGATGDLSLEGSGERALDLFLFGAAHLYTGEGIPFDPEGLLSTLPALANVLGGYLAGRWLQREGVTARALAVLAGMALAALAVALLWSEALPLNKKLWTSSYALLNLGIDGLVLALLAYLIDLRGVRIGTNLCANFGRNTLALYVCSEVGNLMLSRTWIGDTSTFEWVHTHLYAPWAGLKFGSLLYSLTYLLLCGLLARELARRDVHIRL